MAIRAVLISVGVHVTPNLPRYVGVFDGGAQFTFLLNVDQLLYTLYQELSLRIHEITKLESRPFFAKMRECARSQQTLRRTFYRIPRVITRGILEK